MLFYKFICYTYFVQKGVINMKNTLSENILKYRKMCGITQEQITEKLGVSFQTVSKWETGKSMLDVMRLPELADIFNCHIDELFSRPVKKELHFDLCTEFPWPDDTIIRQIMCKGRKIIEVKPIG